MSIRKANSTDFLEMLAVINDGALAYKGVIPSDCWHEPYITKEFLSNEISSGVDFYVWQENNAILGVMGLQELRDVALIRHAYTKTSAQKKGVGASLLKTLLPLTKLPVLIGTWASTPWSIHFYQKYGFKLLDNNTAQPLLVKYWPSATARHREVSVVLADKIWLDTFGGF